MSDMKANILVVDDHKTNRIKMSMAVKKLGHSAEEAENGSVALEKLKSRSFDLVLLDMIMPEMNGYQVLESMKNATDLRNIPVIIISSETDMDSVVKGIEMGAEEYLPKTFDPVLLKARVGACLEKKHFRDQEVEFIRKVEHLQEIAAALENDTFDPETLSFIDEQNDALSQLTRVFKKMAIEFHNREQALKQQVLALRIEIDEARQTQQVRKIVGTNYFQQLRSQANHLRNMLEEVDDD